MYKLLSDLDFGFNSETGKFDKLAAEWESHTGARFWEYFDTEEQRSDAIKQNDEFNKQPEIAYYIDLDLASNAIQIADYELDEWEKYYLTNNSTIPATVFIRNYCSGYYANIVQKYIVKKINDFNKRILKSRRKQEPAIFTLGELIIKPL